MRASLSARALTVTAVLALLSPTERLVVELRALRADIEHLRRRVVMLEKEE